MANFVWKTLESSTLSQRYGGEDIAGGAAWVKFVQALLENANMLADPDHRALSQFIHDVRDLQRPISRPRVFVSHRQDVADYAERIAWLSSRKAGMEYWLDVHDPTLKLASATVPSTDPRYAVIIAAIIEMALLNCTHVIAAHTASKPPTAQWYPSQWIPYELGRAKSRQVYATNAAGWFPLAVRPPEDRGEYVLLAARCGSDDDVKAWLKHVAPKPISQKPYHGANKPQRLPL